MGARVTASLRKVFLCDYFGCPVHLFLDLFVHVDIERSPGCGCVVAEGGVPGDAQVPGEFIAEGVACSSLDGFVDGVESGGALWPGVYQVDCGGVFVEGPEGAVVFQADSGFQRSVPADGDYGRFLVVFRDFYQ